MKLILNMVLGLFVSVAHAGEKDIHAWFNNNSDNKTKITVGSGKGPFVGNIDFKPLPKPNMLSMQDFLSVVNGDSILMGGGITSVGGGDYIDPLYISAWFYGGASIKVCRILAYNFSLEESQVDDSIKKVISFWQSYFEQNPELYRSEVGHPINTRFEYTGNCHGGEDLTLYLGTGPIFQNLSDLRFSQFYRMPVAYPNKNNIGSDLTWAEGYILVNKHHHFENKGHALPDWTDVRDFEIMMAHEFGHVLGLGHDEDSIMRGDIVYQTFLNENPQQQSLEEYFGLQLESPISNFDLYKNGETPIDGTKLSLVQEELDIVCTPTHSASKLKKITIDKRDRYLWVERKNGKTIMYDDVEFLDTAVLFEDSKKQAALFQIFENGQMYITLGKLFDLRENCETVGASKHCPVNRENFVIRPDALKLESFFPAPLPVVEYSQYPNDGTQFTAHSQPVRLGRIGPAMTLIDYGFRMQLVAGEAQKLKCEYAAASPE